MLSVWNEFGVESKKIPTGPSSVEGAGGEEVKFILKLFGRTDGGHSAFDVMVGDAKKILGFLAMPTLTYAGIFSLALDGAIRSLQFKRIVTSSTRFRPPFFALEKNGVVLGALSCYADFSSLIIGVLGAGYSLGWKFLELPGRVGIYSFTAATINIHEGEQSQY